MTQKYEQIYRSRKDIFVNNFIGGIAWGLGATVGVSLLITIIGLLSKQLHLVPLVGTFVSGIIDFVMQTNSHFTR